MSTVKFGSIPFGTHSGLKLELQSRANISFSRVDVLDMDNKLVVSFDVAREEFYSLIDAPELGEDPTSGTPICEEACFDIIVPCATKWRKSLSDEGNDFDDATPDLIKALALELFEFGYQGSAKSLNINVDDFVLYVPNEVTIEVETLVSPATSDAEAEYKDDYVEVDKGCVDLYESLFNDDPDIICKFVGAVSEGSLKHLEHLAPERYINPSHLFKIRYTRSITFEAVDS